MDEIKVELRLPKDQNSLLIYDILKGQTTKRYTEFLLENALVYAHIPAKFESLDIDVNGVVKGFLKDQFQTGYTDEIQKQMDNRKKRL